MVADDEAVDRVRELSDLTEIVSEYITLKRKGSNLMGLCPFHEERTPSFSVSPDRQLFYCFGCQAGGDVFTFVMMIEGLSFPEALRHLADRAGVQLPGEGPSSPEVSRAQRAREYLLGGAEFAATHFEENLSHEAGSGAREYLESRGVQPQLWERYRLGYARAGWSSLADSLKRKGLNLRAAEVLGLVKRAEAGHYFDLLRDRLVFPISDVRGRVIAFGGRALDAEGPKYLNSPENPIFSKGDVWYGLDVARDAIRRRDRVVIVEGYMDVLACAGQDWREAVAAMGTAVTPNQARTLSRYTRNALAAFDADEAGARAALQSFRSFAGSGVDLRVVRLPAGEDPADVLAREEGAPAFQRAIEGAVDFFEFAWDRAKAAVDLSRARGKSDAVAAMAEVVAAEEDPVVRSDQIRRIAEDVRVPEEAVRTGLRKAFRSLARDRRTEDTSGAEERPDRDVDEDVGTGQVRAERVLIAAMLRGSEYLRRGREFLEVKDFQSRLYRTLAEQILEGEETDPHRLARALIAEAGDAEKAELARLIMEDDVPEREERMFEDCSILLKRRAAERKLEELQRDMGEIQRRGETIPVELLREQAALLTQLKGSGESWRSSRGQRE